MVLRWFYKPVVVQGCPVDVDLVNESRAVAFKTSFAADRDVTCDLVLTNFHENNNNNNERLQFHSGVSKKIPQLVNSSIPFTGETVGDGIGRRSEPHDCVQHLHVVVDRTRNGRVQLVLEKGVLVVEAGGNLDWKLVFQFVNPQCDDGDVVRGQGLDAVLGVTWSSQVVERHQDIQNVGQVTDKANSPAATIDIRRYP